MFFYSAKVKDSNILHSCVKFYILVRYDPLVKRQSIKG